MSEIHPQTEQELHHVLTLLPMKLLWAIRQLTLTASNKEDEVPVQPFDKALIRGLSTLKQIEVADILSECKEHLHTDLSKQALRPLAEQYGSKEIADYERTDLIKAFGRVWELLLQHSIRTRRALASQDYDALRGRLGELSPTLERLLLYRLVFVSCSKQQLVHELVLLMTGCSKIALARLSREVYRLGDMRGLIAESVREALWSRLPTKWALDKEYRARVILELLQLFPPSGGASSSTASL